MVMRERVAAGRAVLRVLRPLPLAPVSLPPERLSSAGGKAVGSHVPVA